VVDPRRVAITRVVAAAQREVDVVIAEEPAIPEPVQVLTGDVVEGVGEIPGNGVLAVPAIHELVQRATEGRVSEEILEREVAERGLAVRVVAVRGRTQRVVRSNDWQLLRRGRIVAPRVDPEG